MYQLRRKLLSQNFLHNRKLVAKLLGRSSIGKNDLVLEIGSGKGIITEQLVQKAEHVIAVEIDSHWYRYLQTKFKNADNLTLYHVDILDFRLPALPYKVFANIPFSIEGKIIRKLIDDRNLPDDCYLVMMKEVAYRLAAPYKDNMFSITHKPWFDFSIYHHFRRTDFEPVPSVDVVMLRFTKRTDPFLPWEERMKYQKFVEIGFGHGQPVFQNLKKIHGRQRVMLAYRKLHLRRDVKPSYVSLEQWIYIYRLLKDF